MSWHVESRRPLAGSITVEIEGDRRILCMRGDIDSAVVARFKEEQGPEPPAIDAIDAGAVSFISSTGVAIVLRCSEAAVASGRERPVLRSASDATNRVLRLAGVDSALLHRAPAVGDAQPVRPGCPEQHPAAPGVLRSP